MQFNLAELKQYLLGGLPQETMEAVDLEIIAEPEIESAMIQAEDELMDDYLDEMLSEAENKLFFRTFLVTAERKQRLSALAALKEYAKTRATSEINEVRSEGVFDRLRKIISLNLRAAILLGTGAAVLILVGITWLILKEGQSEERSPIEDEYSVINKGDLSDLTRFSDRSVIALSPSTFRDSEQENRIDTKLLTDRAFFRLPLLSPVDNKMLANARVLRQGKMILSLKELPIYENTAGKEIRLILPKTLLVPGGYQIMIEDAQTGSSIASFNLRIE